MKLKLRVLFPYLPFYLIIGSVFGFAIWSLYFPQFFSSNKIPEVKAADPTITVCADGCDYTTITAALSAIDTTSTNHIIQVNSGYVSSTEPTTGMYFNYNGSGTVALQCESNDIEIGSNTTKISIALKSNSVLGGDNPANGCIFTNVEIFDRLEVSDTALTVQYNTFTTTSEASYINFRYVDQADINNNIGLSQIQLGQSTNGSVANNTLQFINDVDITYYGIYIGNDDVSPTLISNNTISNNILTSYGTDAVTWMLCKNGTNFTINDNEFFVNIASISSKEILNISNATANVYNNLFVSSEGYDSHDDINPDYMVSFSHTTTTIDGSLNFYNNTLVLHGMIVGLFLDNDDNSGFNIDVNATYNIFYGASVTNTWPLGIDMTNVSSSIATVNTTTDYNGFWNLPRNIIGSGFSNIPIGSNSIQKDPFFSNTSTYGVLSDFSGYLDVNGTNDIGHLVQSRVATIPIGTGNLITSYNQVSTTIRNGDVLNFTAGTFDPFTITSLSNITLSGQGATTIINAGTGTDAMAFSSSDSNTLQNFVVQNASSSVSAYNISHSLFSVGGTDYDDSDNFGAVANSAGIFISDSGCDIDWIETGGKDITSLITGTNNMNVALAYGDMGEPNTGWLTIYVPDNFHTSASSMETACPILSTDYFIEDVFVASDGTYTYQPSVVTAVGATVKSGTTDPPTLARTITANAGIKFFNSDSNTIQNVTSTNNALAVWFAGDSSANNVQDSVFVSSDLYDVYGESTANNNLKNVSFSTTSVLVTDIGDVSVYYKARAFVTSTEGSLGGVDVVFSRADSSASSTLTTGSDGYTSFSDYLLAFTLDSSSIAITNGGFNPWSFTASATSTYSQTAESSNLDNKDQTITIIMGTGATEAPTAPSNFATSSIATSSIGFIWTDNSTGATEEDNFIIDYITGSDVASFPGTTSTVSQNAEATTVTGLSPNTQYTFRLAATNDIGTSSYVTSSAIYTNPSAPGTPSAVANGSTSLIVSWSANSNSSGTTYELYNVTSDSVVATTAQTSYTVTGLAAATSYQFKVRARYLSDNESWSDYSANSTSVSTDSTSSGSAGSPIINTDLPNFISILVNGLNSTITAVPNVLVQIVGATSNVSQVALSLSNDFSGISWISLNNGSFSFTLPDKEGIYNIFAKVRNSSGNESKVLSSEVELDYEYQGEEFLLEAPIINSPLNNSLINKLPFVVSGTAEPRAEVFVSVAGSVYNITADELGNYNVDILDQLVAGDYLLTVKQINSLGQKSKVATVRFIYKKYISPVNEKSQIKEVYSGSEESQTADDEETMEEFLMIDEEGVIEMEKNILDEATGHEAFLVALSGFRTTNFGSQVKETIEAVTNEPIEFFIRPAEPVHSIVAQLYNQNGDAVYEFKSKVSLLEKFKKLFVNEVYATNMKSGWISAYVFERHPTIGAYQTVINLSDPGSFELVMTMNNKDGSRIRVSKKISISESGVIYEQEGEQKKVIRNASVEVYRQQDSGYFGLWNADLFKQKNPSITNKKGEYGFAVPAGRYYIKVQAKNYKPFISGTYILTDNGILAEHIELSPAKLTTWDKFWKKVIGLFERR